MQLIEWTVESDHYNEQINIPAEQADLAKAEGISTENKQRLAIQLTNLTTGEIYQGRLGVTGSRQIYLPVEVQKLMGAKGKIRVQILG